MTVVYLVVQKGLKGFDMLILCKPELVIFLTKYVLKSFIIQILCYLIRCHWRKALGYRRICAGSILGATNNAFHYYFIY